MTPGQRRWVFLVAGIGFVAFFLWGLSGLPGFGNYPGPYGPAILRVAVAQTRATGVVSAINFDYRGFDTVGEEFILFAAAAGVSVVLRRLRGEQERSALDQAADRHVPSTSGAVRMVALFFTGPVVVAGWWLASHAQTSPSGGFQGGVVLATAFVLIYLAGEFLVFKRFSPVTLTDVVEAVGAGGVAAGVERGPDGAAVPDQLPAARPDPRRGELVRNHRADQLLRRARSGRGLHPDRRGVA
jgi:multicomponent Na+:H+ antiporter subunit B